MEGNHQSSPTRSVSTGRPIYHFVAPRGWINDPCAPGYDPRTGLYHLFYQWNPKSHIWEDISWGHATSRDMVHWEYSSDEPAFVPDHPYDNRGVFTGCFHPTGPHGEPDQLSIFYTSVCHLPIGWDQPYTRGCEGLSMATSQDGGGSWQKHAANPILPDEPALIHVTGFRDPYIAQWPAMDALRVRGSPLFSTKSGKDRSSHTSPHDATSSSSPAGPLYALISGGIHELGPRTFMYEVEPRNLTKWRYLHPLVRDIPSGYVHDTKWSGDFGANWECTNFLTLREEGAVSGDSGSADGTAPIKRHLVIAGAEGGTERPWVTAYHAAHPEAARRQVRYANWVFGRLGRVQYDDGLDTPSADSDESEAPSDRPPEIRMTIDTAGLLDWGIFYAANTFRSPDGRVIMYGWLIEEDLKEPELGRKGWTGCLGVPREVFLQVLRRVVGTCSSALSKIGSIGIQAEDGSGTSQERTVTTLGIRPLRELELLREKELFARQPGPLVGSIMCLPSAPFAIEISAVLLITDHTESVSLILRYSSDMTTRTSITFTPGDETITVDRTRSTERDDVNACPEIGPHTLFRTVSLGRGMAQSADSGDSGLSLGLGNAETTLEPLRLRVFLDHDVIEVFANDRFALATRVYTSTEYTGVSLACEGGCDVEELRVWQLGGIGLV